MDRRQFLNQSNAAVTATVLAVFLVPVFFISVRSVFPGARARSAEPPSTHPASESEA